MKRTPEDAIEVAKKVTVLLRSFGLGVVTTTRPPGVSVSIGEFTLIRKIDNEDIDHVGISSEVHAVVKVVKCCHKETVMEKDTTFDEEVLATVKATPGRLETICRARNIKPGERTGPDGVAVRKLGRTLQKLKKKGKVRLNDRGHWESV